MLPRDSANSPVNVKAYGLFAKGLTPLQVISELRLSEADATKYYLEYLRLKQLPNLGFLLKRLRKLEKINAFIKLSNLAFAEHISAKEVVQLLRMANSRVDGIYNIEEKIKKYRWVIAHLRKTRQKMGLELVALDKKIRLANDILNQYNLAIKEKKEELAAINDKKIKYN